MIANWSFTYKILEDIKTAFIKKQIPGEVFMTPISVIWDRIGIQGAN